MATTLPTNVNFAQVVGRFLFAEGDSNDAGQAPDGTVPTGTVTFTASANRLSNPTAVPPVQIFPKPVVCTIDSNGFLIDPQGATGVWLVATNDPDLNPHDFTYKVTIALAGMKSPTTFDIAVPVGVVTDLAVVAPIAASNGLTYILGPEGPAGPPGPAGTGNVTSVAGRTGVVVLTLADTADTGSYVRMLPAERTKLTGVASGATVNDTDANLRNRVNHTGVQAISTITDLQDTLDDKLDSVGLADLPAGAVVHAVWSGSAWPGRPTSRTDVRVFWIGGTTAPSGMLTNDVWLSDAP